MSKRGVRFVEGWVSENVHATAYELDDESLEARQYAAQCLAAAEAEGISREAIEEDVGNIVAYMTGAINSQIDGKFARLTATESSCRGRHCGGANHPWRSR